MEEKKHRKPRPEMGTPEYEEWRKRMLQRRRERLKRERRKRLIAIGVAAVLIAGGVSAGAIALSNRFASGSDRKVVTSDTKKENKTETGTDSGEAVSTEASGDSSGDTVSGDTLAQADLLAQQYDYDKAIDLLKNDPAYGSDQKMQAAVKEYEDTKATCTAWPLEQVTHVFYHILIKDTSKAFDGDYKEADYNQVMTTIDEFNKITQTMYDKGYVMVSIKDMAKADENGNITAGEILLPPGKTPFVLSQDDVCYYHYMDGDGFATKLVVDEEGKIRNEYVEDDGSKEMLIGKDPLKIAEMGVSLSFVPEDRLGMGLVGNMDLTDNMMLRSFRQGHTPFTNRKPSKQLATDVVENLEVVTPGITTPVRRLSGGNVQKVLVAREFASAPTVLLTAYVVRGLDINSSYTIYDLINEQKKKGVAVIFVGEDLDVLMELSDRIMVLCGGEVSGILDARKTDKNEVGMLMTRVGGKEHEGKE